MKKQCTKCGAVRDGSEFYSRGAQCKVCIRAAVNARRLLLEATNPEWVEREAARHREKSRRYRHNGRVHNDKTRVLEAKRRWYAENRFKKKANSAVRKAIKAGTITPQPCEVCGAQKVDAHHEDYSKPLDVHWLCRRHHAERHLEINRERRMARFASRSE